MWTFDLTQFQEVWGIITQIGLLLIALLVGNMIRRVVPFLRKGNVPSALIGGLLLLCLDLFLVKVCFANNESFVFVNKRVMQIITYHSLAIGFGAMSLKIAKKGSKGSFFKAVQNGAITGGTYMLQAVIGIALSLIFFAAGTGLFYDTGVLLPLGFGQGPGNALTWDNNFTALTNDSSWTGPVFNGSGSVGLTIASIGFIVASLVGVIYINIFKHKHEIIAKERAITRSVEDFEDEDEIEDSESVDKTSIQIALVILVYAAGLAIMVLFAYISKWTGVKLFNDIAWGFNFIWCVITATLVKTLVKFLYKKKIIKRKYINNYQMDRISGFAFDMMIIAGVAAIDINVVKDYALFIVVVCIAGTLATIFYVRMMCKRVFKDIQHEAFLTNFGTLTGTASNGMIFLREIDPNYETPMNNIFVVSQLPAMLFVAPLLLLLNLSAGTLNGCYIALGIFGGLFILYTVFLFLSPKIKFKKKEIEE